MCPKIAEAPGETILLVVVFETLDPTRMETTAAASSSDYS